MLEKNNYPRALVLKWVWTLDVTWVKWNPGDSRVPPSLTHCHRMQLRMDCLQAEELCGKELVGVLERARGGMKAGWAIWSVLLLWVLTCLDPQAVFLTSLNLTNRPSLMLPVVFGGIPFIAHNSWASPNTDVLSFSLSLGDICSSLQLSSLEIIKYKI